MSATCVAVVTPMTARMMAHDTWTRTSKPRMRATGTRVHRDSPAAGSDGVPSRTAPSRRRMPSCDAASMADARTDATATTTAASTMQTAPTTIAVSCQNWNGKSWTSRSVARIEGVRAAREEDLVEDLEQGVEGEEGDDPAGDEHGDQHRRARADRMPACARGRRRGGERRR